MAGESVRNTCESGRKGNQYVLVGCKMGLDRVKGLHHPANVPVGDHGALGQSGCAGCIHDGGQVIRSHFLGQLFKERRVFGVFFPSKFHESIETHDLGMPCGILFFHDDYLFNAGALVHNLQHLFELSLIFRQNDLRFGIIDNILDLIRSQSRIYGYDACADSQRAHIGIKPFQPVFRKDGNHLSLSDTQRPEPQADGTRPFIIFVPGGALPLPFIFFSTARRSPYFLTRFRKTSFMVFSQNPLQPPFEY